MVVGGRGSKRGEAMIGRDGALVPRRTLGRAILRLARYPHLCERPRETEEIGREGEA